VSTNALETLVFSLCFLHRRNNVRNRFGDLQQHVCTAVSAFRVRAFFMFRVYKLILDFYFCSHLSILAGWGRCGCYAVLRSELGFGVDRRVGSYICCVWRKKVDRPAMAGDECTIPIKPMLLFCLSSMANQPRQHVGCSVGFLLKPSYLHCGSTKTPA